jgi:hypothetical protein
LDIDLTLGLYTNVHKCAVTHINRERERERERERGRERERERETQSHGIKNLPNRYELHILIKVIKSHK